MIIGERFIWGHLGKTGGDALVTLFTTVAPDLVLRVDDPTNPSKHRAFTDNEIRDQIDGRQLALTLRRLPSWRLSMAHHRARHGTRLDPTPQPLPSAEEMAHSGLGDEHLTTFTGNGRVTVDHWLRMEHLRDDFLAFVRMFRPVARDEVALARTVATKPPGGYDHDTRLVFPVELERALYEANPTWAAVEEEVYGYLPYQSAATRWLRRARRAGRIRRVRPARVAGIGRA